VPKVEFVEEIQTNTKPCVVKENLKKRLSNESEVCSSDEEEDWDNVANYKAYIK